MSDISVRSAPVVAWCAAVRTRRTATLALVALAVTACGDASSPNAAPVTVDTLPNGAVRTISSAPTEAGRWSLERLLDIQPLEGDSAELGDPQDVALADDGTILVSEGGSDAHVKVFDASGRFLRRIGRAGEGPGEFRVAFLAVRGDTLLVQDPQVARASTFRISDGQFIGSRPTTCCYWSPLGVDGAGRAVLPANHSPSDTSRGPAEAYVRAPFGGAAADTVFVWQRRTDRDASVWRIGEEGRYLMAIPVPYAPQDVQQADPQGGFVTSWTGEYLLRVSSNGSDTTALFGRPFTPERVDAAEKQRLRESRLASMREPGVEFPVSEAVIAASMDEGKIPDVRPAFEYFRMGADGSTWVYRITSDTTEQRFDLFGPDRVWRDEIRLPRTEWSAPMFAPTAWGADRVAVAIEDEEGRPLIRVFAIRRR